MTENYGDAKKAYLDNVMKQAREREKQSPEPSVPLSDIPSTLAEALAFLRTHISKDDLEWAREVDEETFTARLHHSLGWTIRNDWCLWAGGPLAAWFNEQGITHPDDMSGIILTSLWREIHMVPYDLEGQVKFYQDYWAKLGQ